ncbi:MAG: efflux RND transporter periplasmic adaptor subunit [Burkholderiaceae bacterium]
MTIEKRSSADTIALTGTVQAQTEINMSFRIDGRLSERAVGVGDAVKPGQLVARLDPQNEESSLLASRAQLSAARAQQSEARSNFERMRDLVAENAVSRSTFDQAEAMLKTANSSVEAAQSQVQLSENRLSYTRLVSDVAGVVAAQGAEPGEVVGAGRMIVQVAREGGRDAVIDVPAQVKDSAVSNPDIQVSLTMEPKVTAMGRVREVSPRADPVTGTFRVRVRLIDPPAAMRLGSTVTARMKRNAVSGYTIPASALVRSDRQPAVWIVDPKTGTVSARTVEVQEFEPGRVVVASGLNLGDIVVTAGVQALRAGQKVRLLEARPVETKAGEMKTGEIKSAAEPKK